MRYTTLILAVSLACDRDSAQTSESQTAAGKAAESKTSDAKTSDAKTSDVRTADGRTSDAKTRDAEVTSDVIGDRQTTATKTGSREVGDTKSSGAETDDGKTGDSKVGDPEKDDAAASARETAECTTLPGSVRAGDGKPLAALTLLYRKSATKDRRDNYLPPFTHAELSFATATPIACDERVTALPLAGWSPITVPITSVVAAEADSGVEFEVTARATDAAWLTAPVMAGYAADMPTDVVVLFPASEAAKLLSVRKTPPRLRPKGKLTAVVDIDGDGAAEVAFSAKPGGLGLGDCVYQYRRDGVAWTNVSVVCPD